jgi:MFS transporter, OFA family, oxalate/formate antiporter
LSFFHGKESPNHHRQICRLLDDALLSEKDSVFILSWKEKSGMVSKNVIEKTADLPTKSFITRWPVFYGWIIMMAGTLGLIMTSPGQTYAVSIFIEHFIQDLSINRTTVSALYTGATLLGGVSLPFWGRLVDRKGVRPIVALVSLLFGLACIYMALVQNALMLGVGFLFIRMLGQGSLGLVSQTVINQWWVRRRGLVMGISGFFLAVLGMGFFPNLVYWLIAQVGWRMAYSVLGILLIFGMAPLGFLLYRSRPETYGLYPDNNKPEQDDPKDDLLSSIEINWTVKQAMGTRAFWIILTSFASFTMISTGLFFHMVSIFADQGLPPAIGASVFAPIAISAALANLAAGIFLDRLQVKLFIPLGLLIQAASLLIIPYLSSIFSAFLFGVLLGATNGIFRAVSAVVWPNYFGRSHLGSIYGITSAVGILGAAIGPLPFGIVRDLFGAYQPALYILAGISFGLGLISLWIKKPQAGLEHDQKRIISEGSVESDPTL